MTYLIAASEQIRLKFPFLETPRTGGCYNLCLVDELDYLADPGWGKPWFDSSVVVVSSIEQVSYYLEQVLNEPSVEPSFGAEEFITALENATKNSTNQRLKNRVEYLRGHFG